MDPRPIFPKMFHPLENRMSYDFKTRAVHSDRTTYPVKYYLIDFGFSRKYEPEQTLPREYPPWGADMTVPEFQWPDKLCDPFAVDVYCLGNMFRQNILQVYFVPYHLLIHNIDDPWASSRGVWSL